MRFIRISSENRGVWACDAVIRPSNDPTVRGKEGPASRDDIVGTREYAVASCPIVHNGSALHFIISNDEVPKS